jgi:SOS response regulatory protein OraA/RecX
MSTLSNDWNELLDRQRIKKYGYEIPTDYAQKIKQARFLQNRGFSPESVMRLFR